jgi:hypothetical protein
LLPKEVSVANRALYHQAGTSNSSDYSNPHSVPRFS